MHGQYGWHDIQLFGDIITDVDRVTATLPTLAGSGLMAEFDARQSPGKGWRPARWRFGFSSVPEGLWASWPISASTAATSSFQVSVTKQPPAKAGGFV